MTRPFFVGLATVLAVVVVGIAIQASFDAQKQSLGSHAARPDLAGVLTGLPPSGDWVGAHDTTDIAVTAAWLDQGERERERARLEEERVAAAEAERVAAAERIRADQSARVGSVAPSGGGAPTAPTAASDGGCAYADAIRAAWAGTGDEQWAVNTAMRESHCGSGARNPSGASGIFQLMMPLHRAFIAGICGEPADELVFEPGCNIAAARAMYDGSGRRPWNF